MPQTHADSHSTGCFSFGWLKKHKRGLQPTPPVVISTTSQDAKNTPSTRDYAIEATKRTLEILKGAAGLIPVPLVKEVLELGVAVLSTCEAINEVKEKVDILKNRIAEFLLVIAKVTKDKDGSPVDKLPKELLEDLEELKRCRTTILTRLDQIKSQNRVLTAFLPQANKATIEECVIEFQDSVDRFQTLRGIHAAQDLDKIQDQVAETYGLTQEVLRKVDRIELRVDEVKSGLDELKATLDRKSAPVTFTAAGTMPRVPNIFFGRNTIVDSIAKDLCIESSRICILGPGGQGKTSTALAVMAHPDIKSRYLTRHRYWVPCIGANSPSTFLTILAKHLQASSKCEDTLQAIFAALNETEEPRLILLDNFETPWHPVDGSQQSVKDILSSLDTIPHVNILVTMRSEFPPLDHWTAEKLSGLDVDDARKIYSAIDKDVTPSPERDELLAALGYLPYAITLMATRGKRSLSSPAELLDEWKKSGTDMLSKAEEGMDHSIALSINSKFVSGSLGALHLLQVLSMLPAGVLRSDLKIWINSWESDALDTLREAALVRTSEVDIGGSRNIHLFVLPVVQSYMHRRGRIPESSREGVHQACCEFLVQRRAPITGPSAPGYRAQIAAISGQETNVQALLTRIVVDALAVTDKAPTNDPKSTATINATILPYDTSQQTLILEATLVFIAYQFWTKPRTELANQVILLAGNVKDSWREAEARFCLGHVLWRLSSFREAAAQLLKSSEIYSALSKQARGIRAEFMSLICSVNLPETDIMAVISRFQEAFAAWDTKSEGKEITAWLLYYKALFKFNFLNMCSEAIHDAEESQRLFKELGLTYEAGLSEFIAARCYSSIGDFDSALKALESNIKDFHDSTYGSLGIAQDLIPALFTKARALKALDRWDDKELMELLETCLRGNDEIGRPAEVGQTLVEMAELYVRKKDWPAARLAYEEAIKKCRLFQEESPTARATLEDAQNNLRYMETTQSEHPDKGITFRIPPRH